MYLGIRTVASLRRGPNFDPWGAECGQFFANQCCANRNPAQFRFA